MNNNNNNDNTVGSWVVGADEPFEWIAGTMHDLTHWKSFKKLKQFSQKINDVKQKRREYKLTKYNSYLPS